LVNPNDSNSVIDLIFLWCGSLELNSHCIHPDWHCLSDHAPLTVTILIVEKCIERDKHLIPKNSKKEADFINEIRAFFSKMDASTVTTIDKLEEVISKFANIVNCAWLKHLKPVRITKHSKNWWNNKCSQDLAKYCLSRSIEDWKAF